MPISEKWHINDIHQESAFNSTPSPSPTPPPFAKFQITWNDFTMVKV